MQRNTRQRRAIRKALADADRPLAPEEVLDAAQSDCPGMGMATVYRTIKSLAEEGWLVRVELPGMPDRYEKAGKGHHHHFHCRLCGKVFEVEDCLEEIRLLPPKGFVVEDHEVVFYGRCPECAAVPR
ncbi:MAG: transcriptional repressor [Candidatus Eisenbacteria bacterium]|uniref:Transcriptional repressor n=1 Tax=Eiseniibacteriota bacterium TaxID=2212470 RepID=A0A956NBG4_UNCEI|nr:transcriptional repressor [Candidatus Eisenbacteria bacterium]MCB9464739.1 transcriptional repressor [Candidatus Eisenbacteria bacterium]